MVAPHILVTGNAGFIGFHITQLLLKQGWRVTGIDNVNDYYDVSLKEARLNILRQYEGFDFHRINLADTAAMEAVFNTARPPVVMHLAAQAGVRYSLENPRAYIESNINGFMNVLEGCRNTGCKHLLFASSSSVYGENEKVPFSTTDNVDHPISLYAATKKSNELMAHSYAHLYGLPVTGLRFFTVYGPWGRPDMALFKFTKAIYEGQAIDIYNQGDMRRDFTYIDDITAALYKLIEKEPPHQEATSGSHAPYKIYNIGNNNPEKLLDMIEILEDAIGRKTRHNLLPMQKGDVPTTYADVNDLMRDTGFKPDTALKDGIRHFIEWYKAFYKVS